MKGGDRRDMILGVCTEGFFDATVDDADKRSEKQK